MVREGCEEASLLDERLYAGAHEINQCICSVCLLRRETRRNIGLLRFNILMLLLTLFFLKNDTLSLSTFRPSLNISTSHYSTPSAFEVILQ